MMKPTRANLMRLADAVGATVQIDKWNGSGDGRTGGGEVRVEAPNGHHFVGCDVHEVVAADWFETMPQRYASVIDDIEGGFERCDAETCGMWVQGVGCEWWTQIEGEQ